MNFKANQPAIFTAQTYGTKTTVEIDHCDLDLNEVMDAFQTLIIGMGYSNDALKNWVLEKAEEYREEDGVKIYPPDEDNFRSHFVSNEEADEDAFTDHFLGADLDSPIKKESGWIAQAILDYVDERGAVTYSEMNEFYKAITLGSNSFSHILANLRIPYKNRKTQRYLAKEGKRYSDAKYVVKLANPSNWIVKK